ncbi:hypothetical protein QUA43_06510 [Microcoleus sp. N9_B4]|uniref:hypothetical protein n=1 Tax=Microcoleus sp. N9_B4 TaxID=3055386 RepID=UPI002FD4FA8E
MRSLDSFSSDRIHSFFQIFACRFRRSATTMFSQSTRLAFSFYLFHSPHLSATQPRFESTAEAERAEILLGD